MPPIQTPAAPSSNRSERRPACLILVALTLWAAPAAQAQSVPGLETPPSASSPAHVAARARWQSAIDAFAKADSEHPPATGGVLFVGSSTIRLWSDLAREFRQQPVIINRGFGGSTMADCSLFARELVVHYKPKQVLVYAGDNDLAEGHSPMQVLEHFASFANAVRAELPDTRISYISIKPSPSRAALLPKIRETNNVMTAYMTTLANSDFIDVFTPMLGADGRPRAELFRGDRLHLSDAGYRLWHSIIASHLPSPAAPTASALTAAQ